MLTHQEVHGWRAVDMRDPERGLAEQRIDLTGVELTHHVDRRPGMKRRDRIGAETARVEQWVEGERDRIAGQPAEHVQADHVVEDGTMREDRSLRATGGSRRIDQQPGVVVGQGWPDLGRIQVGAL